MLASFPSKQYCHSRFPQCEQTRIPSLLAPKKRARQLSERQLSQSRRPLPPAPEKSQNLRKRQSFSGKTRSRAAVGAKNPGNARRLLPSPDLTVIPAASRQDLPGSLTLRQPQMRILTTAQHNKGPFLTSQWERTFFLPPPPSGRNESILKRAPPSRKASPRP